MEVFVISDFQIVSRHLSGNNGQKKFITYVGWL